MKNDELIARIENRLAELGRSPITAATKAGLERTYIRDFLIGRKKSIGTDRLEKVARGLDWTVSDLTGVGPFPTARPSIQEVIPAPDQEPPLERLGVHDLPVLGITMGGRKDKRGPDFWMNGEVIRYAPRPRSLEGRKDSFGLYVDGASMEPKYSAGDMVVVERRAPAPGDDVVIELKSDDPADEHDNPSFLKQFVARRGTTITVRQFNPKRELTFDLKEIKNLFRVIPVKELMG